MSFEFFGRTFSFLADSNQQEKAVAMLERYVLKPEILILLAITAIYFLARVIARILKKEQLSEILKNFSPWVYLLVILGITVLNRESGAREIRLMPDNWFAGEGKFHETNVLGFMFNCVLFIPFGYLVYRRVAFCKNVGMTVVIMVITSLSIEILQYILARGVTAVDDLVANIMGGLIGLGFAVLMQKIKDKKRKLE